MSGHVAWRHDDEGSDRSSAASRQSNKSHQSHQSYSTAPTEHSCRPQLAKHDTCYGRVEGSDRAALPVQCIGGSRVSLDTFLSAEATQEVPEKGQRQQFDVPTFDHARYITDAVPATPKDFADLFPTSERLYIQHDDATIDGNMNLRVDAHITTRSGRTRPLTLFHLRMHDLRNRQFSLRRYCRDSGREVCHSTRRYRKPAAKRPTLQKTFSSALAVLKAKSEPQPVQALARQDSGYGSTPDEDVEEAEEDHDEQEQSVSLAEPSTPPTNTINLEFSNYAHVDLHRRGAGSSKRYEFEYWGIKYSWRRHIKIDGENEIVTYHLLREDSKAVQARLNPLHLSDAQLSEERAKGGWILPYTMRIIDDNIINGPPDISE
ncbi:hypothetical protein LTS18_007822 [Coniosporium uncinatum]|uniref:Uncharacterized protein n=1 Tax=Coniosporium uncinatum TaxID=93489 RepID=A0ACC3DZG5_9PEZI|nr:hypothetical protein LTS18_007822 [Coniosporium uncinatum]